MSTTTSVSGKTYKIVKGPSKDSIIDAFKYASGSVHIPLRFFVVGGYTMPEGHPACAYISLPVTDFRIKSLSYEDWNSNNLNFSGCLKASLSSFSPEAEKKLYRFIASYDPERREGSITIMELE